MPLVAFYCDHVGEIGVFQDFYEFFGSLKYFVLWESADPDFSKKISFKFSYSRKIFYNFFLACKILPGFFPAVNSFSLSDD